MTSLTASLFVSHLLVKNGNSRGFIWDFVMFLSFKVAEFVVPELSVNYDFE